jgi:hypothetical protein
VEANLVRNFNIRSGISSYDYMNFTFGMGYRTSFMNAGIAFTRHPVLGYSSAFSLEFLIGGTRK